MKECKRDAKERDKRVGERQQKLVLKHDWSCRIGIGIMQHTCRSRMRGKREAHVQVPLFLFQRRVVIGRFTFTIRMLPGCSAR